MRHFWRGRPILPQQRHAGRLTRWHSIDPKRSDPVPIMTSVQTNRFHSMRKIEQLMNVAITNNNEYWHKDNTSVETIDGVSYVRLHGNLIAEVDDNGIKLYDVDGNLTPQSLVSMLFSLSMVLQAKVYSRRTISGSFVSTMALNSSSLSFALVCDWVLSLHLTCSSDGSPRGDNRSPFVVNNSSWQHVPLFHARPAFYGQ